MNITTEMIQTLRQRTSVGMMDCRKALVEAEGDIEKAVEILRKKGVSVAAKRSSNALENGVVQAEVHGDFAALCQVGCETDFSARTADMKHFIETVTKLAASDKDSSSIEKFMSHIVESVGKTAQHLLDELVSKISENIKVTQVASYQTDAKGVVNIYQHPDQSLASIVEIKADKELSSEQKEQLKALAKDLCMQIAVTNPAAITPEQIDQSLVDKEREIAMEQIKDMNKPEQVKEKIVLGRISKFYEDVCLLNQKFIKDDKLTVQEKINQVAKQLGLELKVARFNRYAIKR